MIAMEERNDLILSRSHSSPIMRVFTSFLPPPTASLAKAGMVENAASLDLVRALKMVRNHDKVLTNYRILNFCTLHNHENLTRETPHREEINGART